LPEPLPGDEARYEKLRGATRALGASLLPVPPMTFVHGTDAGAGAGGDATRERKEGRFWDFELQYTPLRNGFVPVGGLRVLLLEDQVQGAEEAYPVRRTGGPVVLKEWDVVGEIWVKS